VSKESVAAAAKKFEEAKRAPLARLAQIATEQERAYVEKYGSAGDGRAKPVMAVPRGVAEERDGLRRQLATLAAQAKTVAWSAAKEAQDALTAARLSQVGDDASRMADLLAADQMSKTVHPDVLVQDAWRALQAGDVRAASVRFQAAKLAPKPPRPMVTNPLAKEIEAMLDEAVPARKAALETHQATHKAALDLTVAANKAEADAAGMAGDVAAAAGLSVNAKTAAYFADR
jgi:hypothetical protein